jgi:hypothetical protein
MFEPKLCNVGKKKEKTFVMFLVKFPKGGLRVF